MKHLKRFIWCCLLAPSALMSHADNAVVKATTVNNETITIEISQVAEARYYIKSSDKMIYVMLFSGEVQFDEMGEPFVSGDSGEIYLNTPITQLQNFKFNYPTGINETVAGELDGIKVDVDNSMLYIGNVSKPVKVSVVSLSGVVEYSDIVDSNVVIDLSRYGKGVHIVTVDGSTFKLLVK